MYIQYPNMDSLLPETLLLISECIGYLPIHVCRSWDKVVIYGSHVVNGIISRYGTTAALVDTGSVQEIRTILRCAYTVPMKVGDKDLLANAAARRGMDTMMRYAMSIGAIDYNTIAMYAMMGGRIGIVQYILNGYPHLHQDYIGRGAAYNGSIACIQWVANRFKCDWNWMASCAAEHGHMNTIQYIQTQCSSYLNYNYIAYGACSGGKIDILIWAIGNGANGYDYMCKCAVERGHMNIVKFLVTNYIDFIGHDEWDNMAYNSAFCGYIDIVKYTVENGATDYDRIAHGASSAGHYHILQWAIEKGATYTYGMATHAIAYNNLHMFHTIMGACSTSLHCHKYTSDRIVCAAAERGLMWLHEVGKYKYIVCTNSTKYIYSLAKGNHVDMVMAYLSTSIPTQWLQSLLSAALGGAAAGGHIGLIDTLIPRVPNGWDIVATNAAKYNLIDIFIYAMNHPITCWDIIANKAAKVGNATILRTAIINGASDMNDVAHIASFHGHYTLVKIAIDNGADDIDDIYNGADESNSDYILEYIDTLRNDRCMVIDE